MIITIIHCDKCDSTDVLHEEVRNKPVENHYTMTEFATKQKSMSADYDVYIYTNYRIICKQCGHIVRYQK